jgi:hypothetical protein
MASQQKALDNYIAFFEQMRTENLAQLPGFFTEQAHFKDPFNDVRGIERISIVFQHMFETLTAPKFVVEETVMGSDAAYIKWQFTGQLKSKPLTLVGVSRVVFDDHGLVSEHIDYWDASEQFYMTLPILGRILRFIRDKVAS